MQLFDSYHRYLRKVDEKFLMISILMRHYNNYFDRAIVLSSKLDNPYNYRKSAEEKWSKDFADKVYLNEMCKIIDAKIALHLTEYEQIKETRPA